MRRLFQPSTPPPGGASRATPVPGASATAETLLLALGSLGGRAEPPSRLALEPTRALPADAVVSPSRAARPEILG